MKPFDRNMLKQISLEEANHLTTPFFSNSPVLNLEKLNLLIQESLSFDEISISIQGQNRKKLHNFLNPEDLTKTITAVTISPFESPLFWVMTEENKYKLSESFLQLDGKSKNFQNQIILEGFYQYILLEALHCIQKLDPIEQMTLQITNAVNSDEYGIVQNIAITIKDTTVFGSFIITDSFRNNWVQHFAAFPKQYLSKKITKELLLPVRLKIGSVALTPKQLSSISVGDVIIPDHMMEANKAIFSISKNSYFNVTISKNAIHIQDFANTIEDFMDEEKSKTLSEHLETDEALAQTIYDMPLQVHVELAKISLSLDEIMNLSPGNVLEIPELSEKKISLTVQGKKIAVAELIVIGENLGLKILEI